MSVTPYDIHFCLWLQESWFVTEESRIFSSGIKAALSRLGHLPNFTYLETGHVGFPSLMGEGEAFRR